MWYLIPGSWWCSLTVTSIWKSVVLSRLSSTFTSTYTRVQIVPPFKQKVMMRFVATLMPDTYISSTQACHNIFEFPMHMEWPAIYRLSVHLPGQQNVIFCAEAHLPDVIDNVKDTQLLGWFKANQDPDLIAAEAHDHLYQDFPKRFVWNKQCAVWIVCQRYKAVGCMYSISATAGEAFYLCLLLTVIKGEIAYHIYR